MKDATDGGGPDADAGDDADAGVNDDPVAGAGTLPVPTPAPTTPTPAPTPTDWGRCEGPGREEARKTGGRASEFIRPGGAPGEGAGAAGGGPGWRCCDPWSGSPRGDPPGIDLSDAARPEGRGTVRKGCLRPLARPAPGAQGRQGPRRRSSCWRVMLGPRSLPCTPFPTPASSPAGQTPLSR